MFGIRELQNADWFSGQLKDSRQAVETEYHSALKSKLSGRQFLYIDPEKLAWDLLRNGEYLDTNAAVDTCREVNDLVNDYKHLYDRRILFAGFPTMNSLAVDREGATMRAFRQALGTDMQSREIQNKNCFKIIQDNSAPELKQDYKNELYHHYEALLRSAKQFLEQDAVNSKEAVIVLNGHGCKEGLEFNHGGIVPWDKLIHDLSDLVTRRPVQGRHVPYRIHLVIGACYAHCGTYRPSDKDIIVKTFTGPGYESTISRLRINGNGILQNANNLQLNAWAEEYAKEVRTTTPLLQEAIKPCEQDARSTAVEPPVEIRAPDVNNVQPENKSSSKKTMQNSNDAEAQGSVPEVTDEVDIVGISERKNAKIAIRPCLGLVYAILGGLYYLLFTIHSLGILILWTNSKIYLSILDVMLFSSQIIITSIFLLLLFVSCCYQAITRLLSCLPAACNRIELNTEDTVGLSKRKNRKTFILTCLGSGFIGLYLLHASYITLYSLANLILWANSRIHLDTPLIIIYVILVTILSLVLLLVFVGLCRLFLCKPAACQRAEEQRALLP